MIRRTTRVWAGMACLLVGATGGYAAARLTQDGFDTVLDAQARTAVQRWAQRAGRFTPATEVETVLQFPSCSTFYVSGAQGDPVGVVAVRHDTGWSVSAAVAVDADDVTSQDDCRALAQP